MCSKLFESDMIENTFNYFKDWLILLSYICVCIYIYMFLYFEKERMSGGGAEREGEREPQAVSIFSMEPDVGLEPMTLRS